MKPRGDLTVSLGHSSAHGDLGVGVDVRLEIDAAGSL